MDAAEKRVHIHQDHGPVPFRLFERDGKVHRCCRRPDAPLASDDAYDDAFLGVIFIRFIALLVLKGCNNLSYW
jgi:hypothetical protein